MHVLAKRTVEEMDSWKSTFFGRKGAEADVTKRKQIILILFYFTSEIYFGRYGFFLRVLLIKEQQQRERCKHRLNAVTNLGRTFPRSFPI